MPNVKVTAYLLSGFAAFDDWSPDLAGLLEWLILDARGLASSNPTPEDVEESKPIVEQFMPLANANIGGEWYWATSSPCYTYAAEYTSKFRKRWAPGIDSPEPAWGKRNAKWDGGAGPEKSYDLPSYIRVASSVTWYCVGDPQGIKDVLGSCSGIGKKRAHGHGQVTKWEVTEVEYDWHLCGPNKQLMRPIPASALPQGIESFSIRSWGWRPPAWLPSNRHRCAMPTDTARKINRNAMASDG
jgi:CRISPR type IV-associated protein Csf3